MEPTGHYWKAFANWLEKRDGITVVLVNPYETKQAKNWMTTARQNRIKKRSGDSKVGERWKIF